MYRIQGSAVAMPWVEDVNGVVQAWYSGNEVGNALADVLYGTVNPSGRLSLTLPVRIEDIPPYPHLRSENGEINYREDLFVGYKYYQARAIKPLFPFGCVRFELSNFFLTQPFQLRTVLHGIRDLGPRAAGCLFP